MKRMLLYVSLMSIVMLVGIFSMKKSSLSKLHSNRENEMAKPTEGEDREGRRAYIEFLNTGGSDFNWREVYRAQRQQKAERRLSRQRAMLRSGTIPKQEIIGDGLLYGTWKERGANNQAGRVVSADVLESHELVILGTQGGSVMVGPLTGNEYDILNDQMRFDIGSVHSFELRDGTIRVLVVAKQGVYHTDDMGKTWTKNSSFFGDKGFKQGVVSRESGILYLFSRTGEFYTSTDNGTTFNYVDKVTVVANTNGRSFTSMWTARYASGDVYIFSANRFYCYSNGTISQRGSINDGSSYFSNIAVTGNYLGGDTLYATINSILYKSTDAGYNWSSLGDTPDRLFRVGDHEVQSNFTYIHNGVLYFGSVDCFRSENNGVSWNAVNGWAAYYGTNSSTGKLNAETFLHADIMSVTPFQDNNGGHFTLISCDGGTYITRDHKNYLNITLKGMRNSQYYGTQTRWEDPDYILAGAQDQGIQLSMPDSGREILSFNQFKSGDDGAFASSDSGKSAWFSYVYGAMYYHPDTRVPLSVTAGTPKGGSGFAWMAATVADPDDPERVYVGGDGVYYMEHSNGSIRSGAYSTTSFSGDITSLAISPVNSNHWYASTKARNFYHSSDRGITWEMVSSSIGSGDYLVGHAIVADPNIEGRVYVGGNGNNNATVFVSDNHGRGFSELAESPQSAMLKMAMTPDGKYLFGATMTGPYVYIASADMWFDLMGEHAPDNEYFSVEYIPTIKTARFGTHGRGIWDFKIDEGVAIDESVAVSTANAALTVTKNKLYISATNTEKVCLSILTPSGRLLLTKEIQLKGAGGELTLSDLSLADGFYIASIRSGSTKVSKRFYLQR